MFHNWSAWDVRGLNAIMKVPELLEIRIAIYDDAKKAFLDEMLWDCVERFGFKSVNGACFTIDLKYETFLFNLKLTNTKEGFVAKVTPLQGNDNFQHIKFFVGGLIRWNKDGKIEKTNNKITLGSPDAEWVVDFQGTYDPSTTLSVNYPGILFESDKPVVLRCNSDMPFELVSSYIDAAIAEEQSKTISSGGWLADAAVATVKGIAWNTIYEPTKSRFCTPVSRAWCSRPHQQPYYFGSYVLFAWDTFFAGILSSLDGQEIAAMQIQSILQEKNSRGMIANYAAQNGSSLDRSQPPVGAYCVLKLYKQFHHVELLEMSYQTLLEWNNWWLENRDGNQDGLLEWGSDKYEDYMATTYQEFKERKGESFYSYPQCDTHHNLVAARLETGLDNSPMYDHVLFNEKTNTMELADVGLNSLFAMDCWALSEIATILGDQQTAAILQEKYETIKTLINDHLWNDTLGIYCNRDWKGEFHTRLSPTCFYPMIAGVATKERAETMVKRHLLNEEEFWGEFVIPSIAKNDEAFFDNDYWRGRIWGPLNFLVSEGLKRYDMYDIAYQFAKKSTDLFLGEWQSENHIHENYNALSGDGDDVGLAADPVYTWGALLAYIGIGELIEIQPWGELKIGNFSDEPGQITNFPYLDRKLSVVKDKGLIVLMDDTKLLETSVPVMLTNMRIKEDRLFIDLQTRRKGELTIYATGKIQAVTLHVKGQTLTQSLEASNFVMQL